MNAPSDLDRLIALLRAGPAHRLAHLARLWHPAADGPFVEFLAARGVLPGDAASTATDDAAPSAGTPTWHPARPSDSTVDQPPADGVPLPPSPPGGRYEPRRLHRTGGLGAVWVARDHVLGRDVALKTIRPDRTPGPVQVARFVREARVTGALEHPCVVPLYDLPDPGPGGGPCYVMRFVAGRTLAEAAAAYHAKPTPDRLELAALLDAFVAVCRAVGFAHSRGVLHRDLKGQNVVLGEFGEVFLVDWGLAKSADAGPAGADDDAGAADETAPGAIVGTPAFLSPQVADGLPATPASDVYGLGATLYQLLTAHPPFEGGSALEVLSMARTAVPRPVREVNPSAPAALVAICRKAMARNPADRYPSAEAVATEVRRWLADEPVKAYHEGRAARAARWARRHKSAVAAAAAVLVVAAVGSAVTAGLVYREKEQTEAAKQRADANFATARTLAWDLGRRVSAIELGRHSPREVNEQRRQALVEAITRFEAIRAAAPDDREVRRQLAALHRYAGNVARSAYRNEAAEVSYAAALAGWRDLIADRPVEPAYRMWQAETLWDVASVQRRTGRLKAANDTLTRAVQLADGLPDGLLSEDDLRRTRGVARLERAEVEYLRGRFDDAAETARQAQVGLTALADTPAHRRQPADGLLAVMAQTRVGMIERETGRPDAAIPSFTSALTRLDKVGPDAGREAAFLTARVRLERGEPGDVAAAIRGLEALLAEVPSSPLYREWLATAYFARGSASDLAEARRLAQQLSDEHPDVPMFRGLLGRVMATQAVAAGSAPLRREADGVLRAAYAADPENVFLARAAGAAGR